MIPKLAINVTITRNLNRHTSIIIDGYYTVSVRTTGA